MSYISQDLFRTGFDKTAVAGMDFFYDAANVNKGITQQEINNAAIKAAEQAAPQIGAPAAAQPGRFRRALTWIKAHPYKTGLAALATLGTAAALGYGADQYEDWYTKAQSKRNAIRGGLTGLGLGGALGAGAGYLMGGDMSSALKGAAAGGALGGAALGATGYYITPHIPELARKYPSLFTTKIDIRAPWNRVI